MLQKVLFEFFCSLQTIHIHGTSFNRWLLDWILELLIHSFILFSKYISTTTISDYKSAMVPTANIFLVGLFSNKFPNYHPIQFYKLQKIYQIYEITFKDITISHNIPRTSVEWKCNKCHGCVIFLDDQNHGYLIWYLQLFLLTLVNNVAPHNYI